MSPGHPKNEDNSCDGSRDTGWDTAKEGRKALNDKARQLLTVINAQAVVSYIAELSKC